MFQHLFCLWDSGNEISGIGFIRDSLVTCGDLFISLIEILFLKNVITSLIPPMENCGVEAVPGKIDDFLIRAKHLMDVQIE